MIPHLFHASGRYIRFSLADTVQYSHRFIAAAVGHGIRVHLRPPLQIHRSGLPAATQDWHLLPAFFFSLRCRLHSYLHFPHRTAKSILPVSFRIRQRRGHTDARQFSHMRTVGQSDRTPRRHPPPPIRNVGLQTTYVSSRFPHQRGEPVPAHRL